jgi:hypothetical protein
VLQQSDGKVLARVEDVSEDASGRRLVRLEVIKGVRKSDRPEVGVVSDWVDAVPHDSSYMMQKVYERMRTAATPLVYQRGVARASESPGAPSVDLLAISEGLRRPR